MFDSLDVSARAALEPYLQTVRFPRGQCLMREGDEGDGCYLIDSGEIRLELRNVDTDSEGILCHLGPGSVLGEFSLLDGQPRSASAYAQTDTTARFLSKTDFETLCATDPAAGASVLAALGRQLTAKLRQEDRRMIGHLFGDDPDQDTQEMVSRAVAAQRDFASWREEDVDVLLEDIAESVARQAPVLAETNVADTGMGVVADKILKIRFSCFQVCRVLFGQSAAGPMQEYSSPRVVDIASPVGVVLGIIPVTNPVSTIVFKALICLKGRNALILSCHRDALHVGDMTCELIQQALVRHGAPPDLVQWIKTRTDRRKTMMLMRHPDVALILATGGPSIVQAAYSVGKPAIGVGAGNAPVLVCGDADLAATAGLIVAGKSFDNGIICASENNLVVVQSVRAQLMRELEARESSILAPYEKAALSATIFDHATGNLKREFVGKPAAYIADQASLHWHVPPRLLIAPVGLDELQGPYGHEKLAPILSLFTVADEEEGFELCKSILQQQGIGHTAIIHTRNESLAWRFGLEMPASRILVNASGSQGGIGLGSGLIPSLTLGCGTYGRNSTSDNVTYTHLLNIKRLALGSTPDIRRSKQPVA